MFVSIITPLNMVVQAENKGKPKKLELLPLYAFVSHCIFTYA